MDKKEYLQDIYETGTEQIDDWGDQYEPDEFEKWFDDARPSITGYDNQSFYCNSIRAREAVGNAMFDDEILAEVGSFEHCSGWEEVDMWIRESLVDQVKNRLKEYWEEAFPTFDDLLFELDYCIKRLKEGKEGQQFIQTLQRCHEIAESLQARFE